MTLLPSDRNPLDLIERDLVAGAVVEPGGARAFVRRHELGTSGPDEFGCGERI